jgi:Ser/Thr protein kinase RdoA (MazF antagonist)
VDLGGSHAAHAKDLVVRPASCARMRGVSEERARRPVDAAPDGAGPDAAAVATAFDLGAPVAPATFAARGELGRIWRLDTDRGTWAVKQLLEPPDPAAVALDVELQQRCIAAGVPAPSPVLSRDRRPVVVVAGSSVRVHTWVDLLPGPQSVDVVTAGGLLGRMHAAAVPSTTPVDPWFCEPVGDEALQELAASAEGCDAAWADLLRQRVDELVAMRPVIASLDQAGPGHICHCDFNPQNVLVAASGGGVVVDWENAGPFWLDCEVAATVAEFDVPVGEMAAFLEAYRGHGGTAEIRDRSSFAGILAVQVHLIEHYAERALDDSAPQEERARAEFWLADILSHLITVERADEWAAAAR